MRFAKKDRIQEDMKVVEAITNGQWRWNRGDLRLNTEGQMFIKNMSKERLEKCHGLIGLFGSQSLRISSF